MEFRIATDELKKALYRAQGIVERKTTMPILANVLVNATKRGVTVTAFDLDIGIVSEHPAEVTKPGAVTLSAKYVFDIVQNLPDAQVTLKKLANNYVDIVQRLGPLQDCRHGRRGVPQAPQGGERAAGAGLRQHAAGDDQEDPVRHLLGRDALHPQRRLLRAAAPAARCAWWPPTATASRSSSASCRATSSSRAASSSRARA